MSRIAFSLIAALALTACAPARYVKEGVEEAQAARDLSECREIAAHQAFRDLAVLERRARLHRLGDHRRHSALARGPLPGLGELEHRYARICMMSRGYELQTGE
jgi:hypothetical protein